MIGHLVISIGMMAAGVVLGLTHTITGGESIALVGAGAGLGGAGTLTTAVRSTRAGQ